MASRGFRSSPALALWLCLGIGSGCGDDVSADGGGSGSDSGDGGPTTMTMTMSGTMTSDPDSSGGREQEGDGSTGGVEYEVQEIYGRSYIHYARVTKGPDVLNLWIEAQYIDEVMDGEPLPDGVVLLREEGEPEVEFVFIRVKVGDQWEWSNFSPGAPSYDTQPEGDSCGCHGSFEDRTVSIAPLRRFKNSGVLEEFGCDLPNNSVCPEGTYD